MHLQKTIGTLAVMICISLSANADNIDLQTSSPYSLTSFLHFGGTFRVYNFNKYYISPSQSNQHSSAYGGILRITTLPFFNGFKFGLGLYGSHAIESFANGSKNQENTLMGTRPVLDSIGEKYVQYAHNNAMLRIGRQMINSPWISPRDSRMLPATFNGIWGQINPIHGLYIMATRIYTFKSRDSNGFYHDNLYYPGTYSGDQMYGTTPIFPKKAELPNAPGTAALGARYISRTIHAQIWYYNFYGFAQTTYIDCGHQFRNKKSAWVPYINAQYIHQTGGNYLVKYNAMLDGKSGATDSTLWGLLIGINYGINNISLSYNKLEDHVSSFGGGALVSPYGDYTAMYAAVMTANLLQYGPGSAVQIAYKYSLPNNQLNFKFAVLRFNTSYSGNANTIYFDAIYHFYNKLKGLSIRERIAQNNGAKINGGQSFLYNRLMLQYNF